MTPIPRRPFALLVLLILLPLLAGMPFGCAARPGRLAEPVRPAMINHFVVFKLNDPADAEALIADCDALLPTIPGVVSYFAGRHHEVGRETVYRDYDVGMYVGFNRDDAYAAYVDHPNHIELVTRWRPRLEWLRVYDVYDDGQ